MPADHAPKHGHAAPFLRDDAATQRHWPARIAAAGPPSACEAAQLNGEQGTSGDNGLASTTAEVEGGGNPGYSGYVELGHSGTSSPTSSDTVHADANAAANASGAAAAAVAAAQSAMAAAEAAIPSSRLPREAPGGDMAGGAPLQWS